MGHSQSKHALYCTKIVQMIAMDVFMRAQAEAVVSTQSTGVLPHKERRLAKPLKHQPFHYPTTMKLVIALLFAFFVKVFSQGDSCETATPLSGTGLTYVQNVTEMSSFYFYYNVQGLYQVTYKVYVMDVLGTTVITENPYTCPIPNSYNPNSLSNSYDYNLNTNILLLSVEVGNEYVEYLRLDTDGPFAIQACSVLYEDSSDDSDGCVYACPGDCNNGGICDPFTGFCSCADGTNDCLYDMSSSSSESPLDFLEIFLYILLPILCVVFIIILVSFVCVRTRRNRRFRREYSNPVVIYAPQPYYNPYQQGQYQPVPVSYDPTVYNPSAGIQYATSNSYGTSNNNVPPAFRPQPK
eukprot:TRINITY_DN659_c0_g1_i2.p1 TRINITY_DN659_c0_g1~~TRINITY_DN659_c0_g1_i2.p1  ORF type:complete len:353 (+),score=43.23 TRINITY_DN659_c0_g1_i2:510-1568(+)